MFERRPNIKVYREEEKWEPFPALQRILGAKKLPLQYPYYGPTSVRDSIFEQIHKQLELALLTCGFESEINSVTDDSSVIDVMRDLEEMARRLNWVRSFIDDKAQRLEAIRRVTAKRLDRIDRSANSKSS